MISLQVDNFDSLDESHEKAVDSDESESGGSGGSTAGRTNQPSGSCSGSILSSYGTRSATASSMKIASAVETSSAPRESSSVPQLFGHLSASTAKTSIVMGSEPVARQTAQTTSLSRATHAAASSSSSCSLPDTTSVQYLNSEERIAELINGAEKTLTCNFNILDILSEFANSGGAAVSAALSSDGFVVGKLRKILSNILVTFIIAHPKQNVSEVRMREEMAITLIKTFPKMRKPKLLKTKERPWHHWFCSTSNTGYLENVNAGAQRATKRATGFSQRATKTSAKQPRLLKQTGESRRDPDDPDPEEFLKNVEEARNLLPNTTEKANIMHLMAITHERRQHLLNSRAVTTSEVIRRYPHFCSYNGEVIELDFSKLHPRATSLFLRCYNFDFVPKILKLAESDPLKFPDKDYFGSDVLNSMLILRRLLPIPRRVFTHEAQQPLHDLSDLFHVFPAGCDPELEAKKRRTTYPIQPHLMASGSPQVLGQMFLALGDGVIVPLAKSATTTNAVDLLLKTFFALSLHFPLGWKNVFRFLQVHVHEIPLENARESTFDEIYLQIKNTV